MVSDAWRAPRLRGTFGVNPRPQQEVAVSVHRAPCLLREASRVSTRAPEMLSVILKTVKTVLPDWPEW